LIGSNNNHLRLTVEKDGFSFNALWWSHGDIGLDKGNVLDIAYSPQLNVFNGTRNIQLIIKDIHSEEIETENENKIICYDDRRKTGIIDMVEKYLATTKKDFTIFIENNSIINDFKSYKEINKRIINRSNLRQSDGIMFFDYPPTEDMFREIIEKVNPKVIHYMNYDVDKIKNFDYIKTVSGMIKYACNSLEGKFDLNRSACFMGITNNMVEALLDTFEECKSISIEKRDDCCYTIKSICPIDKESLQNSESYQLFNHMLNEVVETRKEFLTRDV